MNNKVLLGIISILLLVIVLGGSYLYSNKNPGSTKESSNPNAQVSQNGVPYEYKKKGEALIKEKYCTLKDCKLDKDLESFLSSKGITELRLDGDRILIDANDKLKYNSFLTFINQKNLVETEFPMDGKVYTYGKDYKVRKVVEPANQNDVANYLNLKRLLEQCVDNNYTSIEVCSRRLNLAYSATWNEFIESNKLEEQFSSLKSNPDKKKEVLKNVETKIEELGKQSKEDSGNSVSIFEIAKNY